MSTRQSLVFGVLVALLASLLLSACGGVTGGGLAPQAAPALPAVEAVSGLAGQTITVAGVGVASARPDMAEIDLGVETFESDAGLALSKNAARMSAVRDVFRSIGVAETDIRTINYSMWAERVWGPDGQPTDEVRYHVFNQINVRLRNIDELGDVMQRAMDAGANNVGGVRFGVADTTALEREAREHAILDARAKAEQLADQLGIALGEVRQVSEASSPPDIGFPPMGRGMGGGGGDVPLAGGESIVTIQVQVTFDAGS